MGFLTIQSISLLLAAGAVGFLIGWYFRLRALTAKHTVAEREWRTRMADAVQQKKTLLAQVSEKEAAIQLLRSDIDALEHDRVAFLHIQKERNDLRVELADMKNEAQRLMGLIAVGEDETRKLKNRLTASENACRICEEKLTRLRSSASTAETPGSDVVRLLPRGAAAVAVSASDPHRTADDLKRISGIGPRIEAMLNKLGIYTYAQIAEFTPETIARIDQCLNFRGRIEREGWVAQAQTLAASGAAAGARRQGVC